MTAPMTLRRKFLTALLMVGAGLFVLPVAVARAEPELSVHVYPATEKKVVITGDLPSVDAERVYTQSELEESDYEKIYYFATVSPGSGYDYYTVRGVSLLQLIKDAHIPDTLYNGAENYLFTAATDGTTIGIGQDLTILIGEGITVKTGSLDMERYTYATAEDFIEPTGDLFEAVDWVLGFAEGKIAVYESMTDTTPAIPDNEGHAIRTYFGQTTPFQYNGALFHSQVYRIVLSESLLDEADRHNDSEKAFFGLCGKLYDRANILSGPGGMAERVKGSFLRGSGETVLIEGTTVSSLLAKQASAKEYVAFSYEEDEKLIVPLADVAEQTYTLVYAAGSVEGGAEAIENTLGGNTYYFDLYRDGAEPIRNITAIDFSDPPVVDPPVVNPPVVDPPVVDPPVVDPPVVDPPAEEEKPGSSKPGNNGTGGGGGNSNTPSVKPGVTESVSVPITTDEPVSEQASRLPLTFTDVSESSYFYNSLCYAVEKGLFSGFADGTFRPQQSLSRAMAATVLWRFAKSPQAGQQSFADVAAGAYYDAAVAWASQAGLILGYDELRFGPQDNVSREQFVAILYRYAASMGYGQLVAADLSTFADVGSISPYALDAMAWAVETGLIKGVSADKLDSQAPVSRAQAAVILHRFALWLEAQL